MTAPRLHLSGISKSYPSVVANNDISLTVLPGEIHALLGENGAGKSTLVKIIFGSVKPDAGIVNFDGVPVQVRNPQEARALGISMVFQHFSLFETLSVAENVWLGLDKHLTLSEVTQRISAKASEYGLDIEPSRPVHTLSVGEMQRVEIIRALLTNPKLLILDEPTSVLTPQAVEKLFVVLKKLSSEGCSILYISHKLHEIRELCTACTVLRAGKVTGHCNPQEQSNASLSRMMIGAEPPALEHRAVTVGDVVLGVHQLSLCRVDQFGMKYALSGEDTRADAAMVTLFGKHVAHLGPAERRCLGLQFVPEERLGRGAVPSMSLANNLMLTRDNSVSKTGWIRIKDLVKHAEGIIARFKVKASGAQATAKSLSGGNLQKFIVGREIDANPKLFIVSQPTWGVDVGAAAQIRAEILALRDAGCAVLVVSEELDELFDISDRLHVMAKGYLSPSLKREDATVSLVGEWMSGLWPKTMNEVSA
jgi:general nucleoside transport system ATP-binding protein